MISAPGSSRQIESFGVQRRASRGGESREDNELRPVGTRLYLPPGAASVGVTRAESTLQMFGGEAEGGICFFELALRSQRAAQSQVGAALCAREGPRLDPYLRQAQGSSRVGCRLIRVRGGE